MQMTKHSRNVSILLLALALGLNVGCLATKNSVQASKTAPVMTELELQSSLMSYADRSASILISAIEEFDELGPTLEARKFVMSDISYCLSAAYTISADPNPQVALLDLTVVMTLGRSIYEDKIRSQYGDQIEPLIEGFKTLENDIWRIAGQVLSPEQQQELRGLIARWLTNNPDLLVYNYIRFGDFDAERRNSTLVERSGGGGLFKSVRQVTEEVEETRMLAERAIFLATRLPLLTGYFAEVWMSQLIVNPDAKQVLSDLHQLSTLPEQLSEVADKLVPQIVDEQNLIIDRVMKDVSVLSEETIDNVLGKVSIERSQAIDQFMTRLAAERNQILRELSTEEEQLGELLGALRLALAEGNGLVLSLNQLTSSLGLDQPVDTDLPPFDIRDYRDTFTEASKTASEFNGLVQSADSLITSEKVDQLLPQLNTALDRVESVSKKLVNHAFLLAILLILIWVVGYVAAKLLFQYLARRLSHAESK